MKFKTKQYNNSIICAVELEKEYLYFTEILDEDNTCRYLEGIVEVDLEDSLITCVKDKIHLKDLNLLTSNEYIVTHSHLTSENILLINLTKIDV